MSFIGEVRTFSNELVIEWKIWNFFSLPKQDGECHFSPDFSFAGESWCLGMCVIDDAFENLPQHSEDIHFDLHLIRQNHLGLPIRLEISLGLQMVDGNKYRESHHTHVFDRKEYKCGVNRFFSKSELSERWIDLAPGFLVVVCIMRYPKSIKDKLTKDASVNCAPEFSVLPENKVLKDYREFFYKKEDCDVIIKVKDQEFPAHRAILKARSSVFASTYRYDTKEKATGVINIEDCEPSSFSDFLCFLYCGDSDVISVENVFSLFTTADKYDVVDLRAKCIEFMKINLSVDTFCDTITLALQHCESELINLGIDFFIKHTLEIAKTVKWQLFSVQNPIQSNELFIKALEAKKSDE